MTSKEVIPDLHHKMSKKIAQLTKVIYHLNTKNEDNQSEIENVNYNHQLEIQHILTDSTSKMNKMKDSIEQKQASVSKSIFNNYYILYNIYLILYYFFR